MLTRSREAGFLFPTRHHTASGAPALRPPSVPISNLSESSFTTIRVEARLRVTPRYRRSKEPPVATAMGAAANQNSTAHTQNCRRPLTMMVRPLWIRRRMLRREPDDEEEEDEPDRR
jgi:hypothetical protein